jgi:hypothetical protein
VNVDAGAIPVDVELVDRERVQNCSVETKYRTMRAALPASRRALVGMIANGWVPGLVDDLHGRRPAYIALFSAHTW